MKRIGFQLVVAVLGLGLAASGSALALPFELAAAPTPFKGSDTLEITLARDGTAQEVRTRRVTVLTQSAATAAAKQVMTYQATLETLNVVEAFTEKRDGRRLDVGRAGIALRDAAAGPVEVHDARMLTIFFPDVAIGDTVVFTVRKEIKRPIFRGQYSRLISVEANIADTVRVIAPKDLWLDIKTYGDDYQHNVAFDDATATHTIMHPAKPAGVARPNEPNAVAAESDVPHIVITTFGDYWKIGHALWAASQSRIQTTPEIVALADEITAGLTDRRAQAAAIDAWVKRNIRYVAIEIGVGGMVPHYASLILSNRYGDCKDHAILMASLLAAKGIDSELVLIRVGAVYALPEAAYAGAFNHMIVYLPEFHMYDDPTAQTAAFGVLIGSAYDQPVVRASAKGVWIGRTPAMLAKDHVAINHTSVNIAADGSVTGETTETTTGIFASSERSRAVDIADNKGLDDGAAEVLLANGTPGQGLFAADATPGLADRFVMNGKFNLGKVRFAPKISIPVVPGLALMPRVGTAFLGARVAGRTQPFVCLSGRQVEEVDVTVAEGLPLPKVAANRRVANAVLSYSSTWQLQGRTLKIRREFVVHVPGQVCSPEREPEIAKAMQVVLADLRTRIAFEDAAPPASVSAEAKPERQAAADGAQVN